MLQILKIALVVFIGNGLLFCQNLEKAPPYYIKSIILRTQDYTHQFPIIQLGERFTMSFDDLRASEEIYYYEITHCDYNWNHSNIIKSDYIQGFDDQRIYEQSNSYATRQSYSHYQISFPNEKTKFKISGNYLLSIKDYQGDTLFTKRFVIYQKYVNVRININRTRDLSIYEKGQAIQFDIDLLDKPIQNPREIKIILLQNYQWNNAIKNIEPQYITGQTLKYKYDKETTFLGGNEYLYFDSKNIKGGDISIRNMDIEDLYVHFLFENYPRVNKKYTYFPDINGNFKVNSINTSNPSTQADYVWVVFRLIEFPQYIDKDIYVYGKYNNYVLNEENKMHWNSKKEYYESKIKLKQGFYNYKYVVKDKNDTINYGAISGNHWQTENDYIVLVYNRNFGARYDSIIGIGRAYSENIQY